MLRGDSIGEMKGILFPPSYMAKGLKFDAVIICDVDLRNYYDSNDKKCVECTRICASVPPRCA